MSTLRAERWIVIAIAIVFLFSGDAVTALFMIWAYLVGHRHACTEVKLTAKDAFPIDP